jgi:hypothetical protein
MADPIATIIAVVIHPPEVNPCYGEDVIELRMVDEAGGCFFELRQNEAGPIRCDLADLELLVTQARTLLAQPAAQDA